MVVSLLYLAAVGLSFEPSTLTFNQGYSPLFGDGNLVRSSDDKSVRLLLDRFSGNMFCYKRGKNCVSLICFSRELMLA